MNNSGCAHLNNKILDPIDNCFFLINKNDIKSNCAATVRNKNIAPPLSLMDGPVIDFDCDDYYPEIYFYFKRKIRLLPNALKLTKGLNVYFFFNCGKKKIHNYILFAQPRTMHTNIII